VTPAAELILRKRDGEELSADELAELVLGYTRGEVPDYQMAAFLMAVYFRGLSAAETFALTDAMIRSGETLDLGKALGRKVVDKHSTGGVGDKTSIAVGPIVVACGVPFGKMSGRGLGHTGGTLDKLESIPGYRVELSTDEFVAQVREVGMAIVDASGLVGQIVRLGPHAAVVTPIDNAGSTVAAYVVVSGGTDKSDPSGVVQYEPGTGLLLQFVQATAPLRQDDWVLTSGLGGTFARGLPIGRISQVRQRPVDLFQFAMLAPAADLQNARQVLVVTDFVPQPLPVPTP
jgi:hypothetical protein